MRELLHAFVYIGDKDLDEHLKSGPRNAQYTSKTIQNEIINCIGAEIQETLVCQINRSKFFTVLADETTDNGKKEQMTLCIRYMFEKSLREDFIQFSEISDVTGHGIATKIIQELQELGIDLSGLVGMGFDGASAMSGHMSGAQATIRQQYPAALYVHCAAHCLNLVISKSSEIAAIRNCWGSIVKTTTWINSSPKRVACLEKHVKLAEEEATRNNDEEAVKTNREANKRLRTFTDTRWVDRHDAVLIF